jgi:hypothetical protein
MSELSVKDNVAAKIMISNLTKWMNDAHHGYSGETIQMSKSDIATLLAYIAELESRRVRVEELRSFVTDADILALRRFCECCDDPESGGHDLEKEQVARLEKIGALQRSGRISYITDFGDYLVSITAGIECEVV